MLPNPLRALVNRARRRPVHVFHHEAYRLPFSGVELGYTLETRRADDALDYLLFLNALSLDDVLPPELASYEALGRVHTEAYLESLQQPQTLAKIFAVDVSEGTDEVLRSIRLAVGGTCVAAKETLRTGHPAMNLLGGFHHAAPGRGAGFCALNDVAVAIASLREGGFVGRVNIIDLDFHPPDGTAECVAADSAVWLGSISGESWGPLPKTDETVLPKGTDDAAYLTALAALLERMPAAHLVFVLAGGDVLSGDRLGQFSLTLKGLRERDLMVAEKISGVPQVWLPAGGYGPHAWKVLAGTGLALSMHSKEPIPPDFDPVKLRLNRIARTLPAEDLGNSPMLTEADVAEALGLPNQSGHQRFLEYYTREGIEFALERYRVLPLIRRLGFDRLRIHVESRSPWERAVLSAYEVGGSVEHTLIELEVDKRAIGDEQVLFVNWLSMRNPRAQFSANRPQLPGQETPGLGLSREMTHILGLMARRLMLAGVAFRPSWFHMAFAARHSARFLKADRQARFEALVKAAATMPLLEATRSVADGRWRLNGQPYTWEADDMVEWLPGRAPTDDRDEVKRLRDGYRFELG